MQRELIRHRQQQIGFGPGVIVGVRTAAKAHKTHQFLMASQRNDCARAGRQGAIPDHAGLLQMFQKLVSLFVADVHEIFARNADVGRCHVGRLAAWLRENDYRAAQQVANLERGRMEECG